MAVHEGRFVEAPLERKVLRDTVHAQLFRMLVDGSLAPGMTLSIDGLARDLCVSPTPVREALVHLEHTGLVRRAALRGYTVAEPPSPQELGDLVAARRLIEGAALNAALRTGDGSQTGEAPLGRHLAQALEAQQRSYEEAVRHGVLSPPAQLFAYLESEWEFHRVLVLRGGNPYLVRMADLLAADVHRGRRGDDGRLIDATDSLAEHRAIVAAVESGRPGAALEALTSHLDALLARALARVRPEND